MPDTIITNSTKKLSEGGSLHNIKEIQNNILKMLESDSTSAPGEPTYIKIYEEGD